MTLWMWNFIAVRSVTSCALWETFDVSVRQPASVSRREVARAQMVAGCGVRNTVTATGHRCTTRTNIGATQSKPNQQATVTN